MANKRSKKRSGKKRRKSGGGGRPPPRKRDDKAALRGMLVGGVIFALLAFVLMVPIGGATPFSHLLQAVGLTGEEVVEPGDGPGAKPGEAPPQEAVTEDEQQGLDDLIEKKTE